MDEILFRDRNREYGAYQLRRRYPRILLFSILISILLFVFIVLFYFYSSLIAERNNSSLVQYFHSGGTEYLVRPKNQPPPASGGFFRPQLIPQVVDSIPINDTLINMAEGNGTDTAGSGSGTGDGEGTGDIYLAAQEAPAFPGGEKERMRFLQQNIRYPAEAKARNIQGAVYVSFVVEKNGSISYVKLLKGIGYGCDEEALRVIQSMPRWIPGKQNGTPVRVQVVIPLQFVATSS